MLFTVSRCSFRVCVITHSSPWPSSISPNCTTVSACQDGCSPDGPGRVDVETIWCETLRAHMYTIVLIGSINKHWSPPAPATFSSSAAECFPHSCKFWSLLQEPVFETDSIISASCPSFCFCCLRNSQNVYHKFCNK